MNTNITNPMKKELFTAEVKGMPPKLLITAANGSSLKTEYGEVPKYTLKDCTQQYKIRLADNELTEEAQSLASGYDCGTSLTLKSVSQNTYKFKLTGRSFEKENVSHVILQVKDAKLLARVESGVAVSAGPVAPMMPGSQVPAPVGQALGGVNAPVNVQPAVAKTSTPVSDWDDDWGSIQPVATPAITTPAHNQLSFCLPDSELIPANPLTMVYKNLRDSANRNLVSALSYQDYQYFLRREINYLALQEKLTAIAAHDKLSHCLPDPNILAGYSSDLPRSYVTDRNFHGKDSRRQGVGTCLQPTEYQYCLQKERDYLAQQEKNEYNAAS